MINYQDANKTNCAYDVTGNISNTGSTKVLSLGNDILVVITVNGSRFSQPYPTQAKPTKPNQCQAKPT